MSAGLVAGLTALVIGVLALLGRLVTKRGSDAAIGGLEKDRQAAKAAQDSGNDDAVLREFRKQVEKK